MSEPLGYRATLEIINECEHEDTACFACIQERIAALEASFDSIEANRYVQQLRAEQAEAKVATLERKLELAKEQDEIHWKTRRALLADRDADRAAILALVHKFRVVAYILPQSVANEIQVLIAEHAAAIQRATENA